MVEPCVEVLDEAQIEGQEKKKQVTFSRPPFSQELFTPDTKRKFDDLPDWERLLIKRLLEHGDLKRAAEEAGVPRHAKDSVDLVAAEKMTIVAAMDSGGLTPHYLVQKLAECIEAKCVKFDRHQNPIQYYDRRLSLNALRLAYELRGSFPDKNHTQGGVTDAVELFKDVDADE